MKKILLPLAAILFFAAWQTRTTTTAVPSPADSPVIANASMNEKVTICHREGNGSSHSITVSINAVPAHLAHGDAIGDCNGGPARGE